MATSTALSGAATVGGNAAFSYNRENFMFDAGQRWARYMAGYTFAQDQVGMYREDIDQMSDITISKMDNIHGVSGLMMVIVIQLIMAGRLGVHGPAPPGWLMGMYWVNCGLMTMWLMITAWLAIHGGARAQAGATYLKTRSVRLPIPTPKQLDKARVFGNHWERQRFWDVFRVPFVAPAPTDGANPEMQKEDNDSDSGSSSVKGGGGSPGKKKTKTLGPTTDFRTPAWVNEEMHELQGGQGGAPVGNNTTPEHFELFRGLQHEWWQHETYARICIFLTFTHWMSAASLYIQCHCFIELRANWPAYSCVAILCSAHYCINMLDVMRVPRENTFFNVPMELIVPFPPLLCAICMGIDYSVLEEWRSAWVVLVWICSFLCYITYFLYELRVYDLCMPCKQTKERIESPGQPWWPNEWSLPISFQHAMYMVSPPKFLEPGESCLWQEMKAGKASQSPDIPAKQRVVKHNDTAWRVVQAGCRVAIILWIFIICGRIHAVAWTQPEGGDMRYMLKQEGRVMRWPSHMQPWMSPWTREHDRGEWCHTGGCDRRLGHKQSLDRHRMAEAAKNLVPMLQTVSEVLEEPSMSEASSPAQIAHVNVPVTRAAVTWPAKFRPELLTCSHNGPMAVLARSQRAGALIKEMQHVAQQPENFVFGAIDHLGEVLGSHWGEDGMLLTMKSGHLAECTGMPANGLWPCQQVGSRLPSGGVSLRKAVVARVPSNPDLFRAAVVFNDTDSTVALFESAGDSGVWFPTGEAQLPAFMEQVPSFSLSMGADELVLLTEGGGVFKWAFADDEPKVVAAPPREALTSNVVWQTACHLKGDRLARLGHHEVEGRMVPDIFMSTGK